MNRNKRILSIVIAAAMTLGLTGAAFAANPVTSEFANGSFSSTPETEITATNLTEGDSAEYFQVLKWDPDNGGWVFVSSDIETAIGLTVEDITDGITEAEATEIANAFTGAGTAMSVSGTTASATGLVAGLYYIRAIPADDNKSTVYNPAFASCDYYEGGNTVDLSTAIAGETVLKKTDVPLEKEVDNTEDLFNDVKPGDLIPFKITTTIPSYGTTFTNPVFTITDVLSDGLELDGDVTVKYGTSTTTESVADVVTITKGTPENGFTVEFEDAYLTGLAGATPDVEITYKAKVTTEALNNVTFMDNTATLEFSNKPGETVDKDDITRHYTFTIDGLLNGGGETSERTHEAIKVGVDKDGNPVVSESEQVTYHGVAYGPLGGATYKLTGTGTNAGVEKEFTTGDDGHIVFEGLDAGTYTLEETAAPAGFIRDTMVYTVTIIPEYDDDTRDDAILLGYEITIEDENGKAYAAGGATFTVDNQGTVSEVTDDISSSESDTNPFNNTRGVELPSTGGMGTTLFYVIGTILVLGAGILLVTRRRMGEN